MSKIRVVTDSACDIPRDIVEELGITVVPLTIRFGDEEFVDCQDLTPQDFWAKCKVSDTLPETAAPSPGAFQSAYEQALADGYDGVLAVCLSSKLSATHQSATLGADGVAGKIPVTVIDSLAVTMAQGLIVMECAEAAQKGASLEELTAIAHDAVSRAGVIGTIDTLEHLIKGGRIGGAKAMLGSMLSIKPLLELKDGVVAEAGRQRTRSKAVATCVNAVKEIAPVSRVAIVHGDAADIDAVVAQMQGVASTHPLIVTDMGSVVGTHGGPGIVGVCWLRA